MLDTKRIHENEDLERKETEAIKFKEDLKNLLELETGFRSQQSHPRPENSQLTESPEPSEDSCCSNTSCCPSSTPVRNAFKSIGRNDPCPCGSGNKFKKCCL